MSTVIKGLARDASEPFERLGVRILRQGALFVFGLSGLLVSLVFLTIALNDFLQTRAGSEAEGLRLAVFDTEAGFHLARASQCHAPLHEVARTLIFVRCRAYFACRYTRAGPIRSSVQNVRSARASGTRSADPGFSWHALGPGRCRQRLCVCRG
jgi:hypothetical protein